MVDIQARLKYFFSLQGIIFEESTEMQTVSIFPSSTLKLVISFRDGKLIQTIEDLSMSQSSSNKQYVSTFDKFFMNTEENRFEYRSFKSCSNLFEVASSITDCLQLFKKLQQKYFDDHENHHIRLTPNKLIRYYDAETYSLVTGERTGSSFKKFFFVIEKDLSLPKVRIQCYYLRYQKNPDKQVINSGQVAPLGSKKKENKAKLLFDEDHERKELESVEFLMKTRQKIEKDVLGLTHDSRF